MPTSTTEWMDAPRCEVDVRYDTVVADTLRAASKSRFDPTKLMKVVKICSGLYLMVFSMRIHVSMQGVFRW